MGGEWGREGTYYDGSLGPSLIILLILLKRMYKRVLGLNSFTSV